MAVDAQAVRRYTQSVMALLALKNVSKHTVGTWALWDVTLEIGAGEIVGVLGRSGSGKSTLASILAGLQEPTSGSVVIGEPDNPKPFKVGVAFSAPAYAPELTVYENLDMFASACGMVGNDRVHLERSLQTIARWLERNWLDLQVVNENIELI